MATIKVLVRQTKTYEPISGAPVLVAEHGPYGSASAAQTAGAIAQIVAQGQTDPYGRIDFELHPGAFDVAVNAFGEGVGQHVDLGESDEEVVLQLALDFGLVAQDAQGQPVDRCMVGDVITLEAVYAMGAQVDAFIWTLDAGEFLEGDATSNPVNWDTTEAAGNRQLQCTMRDAGGAEITAQRTFRVRPQPPTRITATEPLPMTLARARLDPTADQALWIAIRSNASRLSFTRYLDFIDLVLCQVNIPGLVPGSAKLTRQRAELYAPVYGTGAYELLKTATEVFLLLQCGAVISGADFDARDEASRLGRFLTLSAAQAELVDYIGNHRLPYIQRVLRAGFPDVGDNDTIFCGAFLEDRTRAQKALLLELIWSYWHEEAMLVQSMKAISLRFQNRRRPGGRDPLAHLEIAPLFPINNLLWGYVQDEQHRLSVPRRAYEYNHQYGLTLAGRAVSDFQPADSRSRFLEAFHHLLSQSIQFYRQDDDTTVHADAFPLLNALREVHLLLAAGLHNQAYDLTWTARVEMLIEQWILSRPELREFLQSRAMVPYREPWMAPVDTMKRLQGWTDTSVTHFNELAEFGEQLLLSVRYGDWVDVNNPLQAANWARSWRPEIQGYIHAYRAATGVELQADVTSDQQRGLLSAQPSALIHARPASTTSMPALPPARSTVEGPPSFRERRALRRQSRP